MSNVLHECPEESCASRAYIPAGNPERLRCPNPAHGELYKQVEETPAAAIEDPEQFREPSVLDQQPTSIDAVMLDGTEVDPEHQKTRGLTPLPTETAAVTNDNDKVSRGKSGTAKSAGTKAASK